MESSYILAQGCKNGIQSPLSEETKTGLSCLSFGETNDFHPYSNSPLEVQVVLNLRPQRSPEFMLRSETFVK